MRQVFWVHVLGERKIYFKTTTGLFNNNSHKVNLVGATEKVNIGRWWIIPAFSISNGFSSKSSINQNILFSAWCGKKNISWIKWKEKEEKISWSIFYAYAHVQLCFIHVSLMYVLH